VKADTGRRLGGRLAIAFRRDGRVQPPAAWPAALAAGSRRLAYGERGALLVAREGVAEAESATTVAWLAGALRAPAGGGRGAGELLAAGAATGRRIDLGSSTGSALVLAADRREPRLAAAGTYVAMQPLYWARTAGGFAAATEPGLLLPLLDRVELDERAVPAHFLFRYVAGERTYFRGVRKLLPGYELTFDGRDVTVRLARSLRDVVAGLPRFTAIDERGVAWLDARMRGIVAAWAAAAARLGCGVGNLLSGGLDSSLVQAWLHEAGGAEVRRSYSFAIAAASFDFEVDYALLASRLIGSRHEMPRFAPELYGEHLDRALELTAEPSFYNESWPLHLFLAERLAADPAGPRVLFTGYGADVTLGDSVVDPIQRWIWLQAHPRWRESLAAALPRIRGSKRWETWIDALETSEAASTLRHPLSHVLLTAEPELMLPAFGGETLAGYFDELERLEAELLGSDDLMERMHVIDFLTAGYDPHLSVTRLYAARGIDLVHPYLEEEGLASGFAFSPEVRYLRPSGPWATRFKPLQQELLRRRGLGALVGRRKGGTTFGAELWQWLSAGFLRERLEAIERPAWLSTAAMAEVRSRPTDFLWNLLTFDTWNRRVLRPASVAAATARVD